MSLILNRKAKFNYELVEKYSVGIELMGYEVKSLKNGQGSLDGAHITIRGQEAFLIGMHIPPYQISNTPSDYDSRRNRKLLLTKKELSLLENTESQRGLTIVPLSVYNKGRYIKLEIAIARGKKKFDKRESIKKRDSERDIRRSLKN